MLLHCSFDVATLSPCCIHCRYVIDTMSLYCRYASATLSLHSRYDVATLLLRCRYTSTILSLQCCYDVAKLSAHCRYNIVTQCLYCRYTVATMSLYCRYAVATMFLRCRYTVAILSLQCRYNVPTMSLHSLHRGHVPDVYLHHSSSVTASSRFRTNINIAKAKGALKHTKLLIIRMYKLQGSNFDRRATCMWIKTTRIQPKHATVRTISSGTPLCCRETSRLIQSYTGGVKIGLLQTGEESLRVFGNRVSERRR